MQEARTRGGIARRDEGGGTGSGGCSSYRVGKRRRLGCRRLGLDQGAHASKGVAWVSRGSVQSVKGSHVLRIR